MRLTLTASTVMLMASTWGSPRGYWVGAFSLFESPLRVLERAREPRRGDEWTMGEKRDSGVENSADVRERVPGVHGCHGSCHPTIPPGRRNNGLPQRGSGVGGRTSRSAAGHYY